MNTALDLSSSDTITPIEFSASEITDVVTSRIQIELQQNGPFWHLKGCTAYVSDGTMRPIPFKRQDFRSRTDAIQAMKRAARSDIASHGRHIKVRIKWLLVLWRPE